MGRGDQPTGKVIKQKRNRRAERVLNNKVTHTLVTDRRKTVFGEPLGRVEEGGQRSHPTPSAARVGGDSYQGAGAVSGFKVPRRTREGHGGLFCRWSPQDTIWERGSRDSIPYQGWDFP